MAAVLASVAGFSVTRSDKEQLARVNQWFEVALNNMARGLSMFDAEQRLIVCNRLYREIYDLPEELTRPGHTACGYRALPRDARDRAREPRGHRASAQVDCEP